jgi:hypothetical protein
LGVVTFTYRLTDALAWSGPALVTLTIVGSQPALYLPFVRR